MKINRFSYTISAVVYEQFTNWQPYIIGVIKYEMPIHLSESGQKFHQTKQWSLDSIECFIENNLFKLFDDK